MFSSKLALPFFKRAFSTVNGPKVLSKIIFYIFTIVYYVVTGMCGQLGQALASEMRSRLEVIFFIDLVNIKKQARCGECDWI